MTLYILIFIITFYDIVVVILFFTKGIVDVLLHSGEVNHTLDISGNDISHITSWYTHTHTLAHTHYYLFKNAVVDYTYRLNVWTNRLEKPHENIIK